MNAKFLKFALTGSLGTLTNLIVFYCCYSKLEYSHISASIIAFFIAVYQNYIINNFFTFQNKTLTKKKYLKYLFSCLTALLVNLLVLQIFIVFFSTNYLLIFQLLGILSGTLINFYISSRYVFKNKNFI